MTDYPTLEDALALIEDLGVGPVRDLGLLDSGIHRPGVSVFGREAYPDIDAKPAVLLESRVTNYALVDGNMRLGWLSVVVFYGLNGIDLEAPDDEAYDVVIAVASGEMAYQDVALQFATWRSIS